MPARTSYEDYGKCIQGCGPGGIACWGVGDLETIQDGPNTEVGRWRWMWNNPSGSDCNGRDYPPREVRPGTRIWYPELIVRANGSVRFRQWASGGAHDDVNGMHLSVDVEYTREEWEMRVALEDDDYVRSMDWRALVIIFWSLRQYECRLGTGGGMFAGKVLTIMPSPVSPQSLAGSRDMGSLWWLDAWEGMLRDRIWRLRPDLRAIRMPDGSTVEGIINPDDRRLGQQWFYKSCSASLVGELFTKGVGAIAAIATVGAGILGTLAMTGALDVPRTIADFRQMAMGSSLASRMQDAADAIARGNPELDARASGGVITASPAQPGPVGSESTGGILAIAAVAALVALA